MKAEEARRIAEEFTPDIKEILEIIKEEANSGRFSTSKSQKLLYDERTRNYLQRLGYKVKFIDQQRDLS